MTRRWIPGSLLTLTMLASCAGGAREVGQHAVDTQRNQQPSTTAGGSSDSAGDRITSASSAGSLARPSSGGRDESPVLVTVVGRTSDAYRRSNAAVSSAGAIPSSGSFVVRAAGNPGSPSALAGDAPSDGRDSGRVGEAVGHGGLGATATSAIPASSRHNPAPPREMRGRTVEELMRAATGSRAASVQYMERTTAMRAQSAPSRTRAAVSGSSRGEAEAPRLSVDRSPAAEPRPVGAVGAPMARPMPVEVPVGSTLTVTTTVAVSPPVILDTQQETTALLTAASVGDADRFANYVDYLARHANEAQELRLDMTRRLRIKVVDSQGRGVNAARIRLSNQGGTVEALTHADGSFDYFPNLSTAQLIGAARLDVAVESSTVHADVQIPAQGDGQPVTVRLNAAVVPPAPVLDLGFLIDVTGSMGDELAYINREVASIVRRIERDSPGVRVRLSATFYRDRVDEAVVQQIAFTSNVQGFAAAMQNVQASGGGDYPEDLDAGLDAAMNRLAWSDGAAVRVLVLVADAPPQHYGDANFTYRQAMVRAAQRGIRLLPVAASGSDRRVEFLFRAMGAYTSTPYVYLTDDSGVGGSHMEADTDRVAVERFNDALVRLVTSDLRGEGMHEPGRLGGERS